MKTIEQKARKCLVDNFLDFIMSDYYTAGAEEAQEFIPIAEEYPPYDEDILIQTQKNIYFGKLHVGSTLEGVDYFQPDLADASERIKAARITGWRPIFYK